MSEATLPSEFGVFLFSDGSREIYLENKLNSFTVQLSQPINFDLNSEYYVGLSEMFVDDIYQHIERDLTKDSIIFYPVNIKFAENIWEQRKSINTLDFLVRYCLSQVDYTVYDDAYFTEFQSPYFMYSCYHVLHQSSISQHEVAHESFYDSTKAGTVDFDVDLGLGKNDPLFKYKNERIDKKGIFRNFVTHPFTVKFKKGLPYTLSNVLFRCIQQIVGDLTPYNLDIQNNHTIKEVLSEAGNDEMRVKLSEFKELREFGEEVKIYRENIHLLIQQFISHFISLVKNYQKNYKYEEKIKVQDKPSYMMIYSDIVQESIINNTKARLLAVIPVSHLTNRYISYRNINYYPVVCSEIRSVSIVLATDTGALYPLKPSYVPTYIGLRFKKINN